MFEQSLDYLLSSCILADDLFIFIVSQLANSNQISTKTRWDGSVPGDVMDH